MNMDALRISVTFLTGRYHGVEWPASPARLYQALVASISGCGFRDGDADEAEAALRWLERQPPPTIEVCDSVETQAYSIAVPNNDMDVVAKEWAAGRMADPAKLRTMKEIRPRQMLSPGPHIQYVWSLSGAHAHGQLLALRRIVRKLHTFGWGIDMAYADLDGNISESTIYRPSRIGIRLAVPQQGTLDDLHQTYGRFIKRASGARGVDTDTRPSVLRLQPYRRDEDCWPPSAAFMLMHPNSDATIAVPWRECMKVAGWLRHAAAESLASEYPDTFINEYVLGHTVSSDKSRRISYVPLPSLHPRHGDGLIRRTLILEPPDSDGEIVSILGLKLTGRLLFNKEGQGKCALGPVERSDWVFNQYTPQSGSRIWRSVTPVVLHGHNAGRRGSISVPKTEGLLLRAFEMAGITAKQIASLSFQGAPLWPGARHAMAMLVPEHLTGYPRVHVQVKFQQPLSGPVLAGIGRHYGIGLFAAAAE